MDKLRTLVHSQNFVIGLGTGVIVVCGIAFFFFSQQSKINQPKTIDITPTPTKVVAVNQGDLPPVYPPNTKVRYSTSTYSKYGYEVYPEMGSDTQKVLSELGFTISEQSLPDGSLQVTLYVHQKGFDDVTVLAKPGETMYFEKLPNYGDPSDAGLILVNAQGEMIQTQQ